MPTQPRLSTMIDPLDSETPVKRRRSKKKVHFTTREIRDDKENTTRVESITPLQKATPPAKRLARRLVGRMRSASSNLFGARGSIGAVVEEEAKDAGAAEVEEEASDRASDASDRAPRLEALDWAKPLPDDLDDDDDEPCWAVVGGGLDDDEAYEEQLEIEDSPASLAPDLLKAYQRMRRANDDYEMLTGRPRRAGDDADHAESWVDLACGVVACASDPCVDDGFGRAFCVGDETDRPSCADLDEDLELEPHPCNSCSRIVLLAREPEPAAPTSWASRLFAA